MCRMKLPAFICVTVATYLVLCTVQLAVDTVLTVPHSEWSTFVEQSRKADLRSCDCENDCQTTSPHGATRRFPPAPPPPSPPPPPPLLHSAGDTDCGQLLEWGTVTVRHPRRPWNASVVRDDGIYVSFDVDLEFAVPLEGMTFDMDSELYIFYHSNAPSNSQIQFNLDDRPPRSTPAGGPFNFMGVVPFAAETLPRDTLPVAAAAPFRTANFLFAATTFATGSNANGLERLGVTIPMCHSLSATLPNGRVTVAKFKTVVRLPKVWLVTTVGVENDLPLLQHFLAHYTQTVGVEPENIIVTVHAAFQSDPRVSQTRRVLKAHGIVHVNAWFGMFNTFDKYEIQESLSRRLVLQQDWVINADLDEHHHYPFMDGPSNGSSDHPGGGIHNYLSKLADLGISTIFGELKDRVNVHGSLVAVDPHTSLSGQFALTCNVTRAIVGGSDTKVMARKGTLMAAEGGYHGLYEWKRTYGRNHHKIKVHPITHQVWHYKWTSQVLDKLKKRERQFKAQGIRWWVQSSRMRTFLEDNNGTINVGAAELGCLSLGNENEKVSIVPGMLAHDHQLPHTVASNMFTVVLMSYSPARRTNQEAILRAFGNMIHVKEVIFVWNSDPKGMPSIPKGTKSPIRVDQQTRNSLNNRWMESLGVETDAVLMMDDDMMLPPHTVRSVFARWKHSPDRLVGTSARNFNGKEYLYPKHCCETFPAIRKTCSAIPTRQPAWCAHKLPARTSMRTRPPRFTIDTFCDTFKLVLPKGMMFHRKYLGAYSNPANKRLWEYVDEQGGHCDDIAFNFVVANLTGLAGVMVDDPVFNFPESDSGLYDASSETSKVVRNNLRGECLTWITEFFNGVAPPPFYVEAAEFWLRKQQQRAASPVVAANRQYSVMWNSMQQCVGKNGATPR